MKNYSFLLENRYFLWWCKEFPVENDQKYMENDATLCLRGEYIYLFMYLLFSNSIIELIDKESRTSSSIPWYHV